MGLVKSTLLATLAVTSFACSAEHRAQPASAAPPSEYALLGQGVGDATLVDQDGAATRWDALNGRPRILFFGYTHCPAICPTTMLTLANAFSELSVEKGAVTVTFVSVDPGRDTSALLKSYLSNFSETDVRGYTGDLHEVERVAHAYRAAFRRVPLEGDDYAIDHTALVYLLNADGRVVETFAFNAPNAEVLQKMRAFLRRSQSA